MGHHSRFPHLLAAVVALLVSIGCSSAGRLSAASEMASTAPNAPSAAEPSTGATATPADPDPWQTRLPGASFSQIVEDANTIWLTGPQQIATLGISKDWGGALTYFGQTDPNTGQVLAGTNVIDRNDTGRLFQLAFYDPNRLYQLCAYTLSCASGGPTCGTGLQYLGWDPVQGGSYKGAGSPLVAYGQQGNTYQIEVVPMFWNPCWDQNSCTTDCNNRLSDVKVTMTYRFVSAWVVEIGMELMSLSAVDHGKFVQEFPTMYVGNGANGSVNVNALYDPNSDVVDLTTQPSGGISLAVVGGNDKPWASFQSTGGHYGVGLALDVGETHIDALQASDWQNLRSMQSFSIGPNAVVRNIAYLALGSIGTINGQFETMLAQRPAFGVVDAPAAQGNAVWQKTQPLSVSGWVLDNKDSTQIAIAVDGQLLTRLSPTVARPDVCALYANYRNCPNPGFTQTVDLSVWAQGSHTLSVQAIDSDNNVTTLASRAFVLTD